ncbi:major urinary protein 20-like [Oryctolagus cuniculus]|uniref:major urinary protein 20-like n=1 Tax=Oryctolagus cuniculus TaxID=9986 RepID=UPI0038796477
MRAAAASLRPGKEPTAEMQPLLLSLLWSLAWALQDQRQVPVQPAFRPEQVEGRWHTIKLGATDRAAIEEGGSYRCYMSSIRLLENGDLKVTYFHRQDGRCVEDFYIAEKTDSPGRYTFEYEGKNYLTFVAASDDFVIMDLENHSDRGQLIVAELHSRAPWAGELGQEAYRKHTQSRGIRPDDVVDLSVDPARCSPSEP